jgi:hypothetical protein
MIRWAHENQLDWTQSLKQQLASRQQPTPPQQPTQQRQTRPLPNGRSAGNGAQPVNGQASQFNENASWSEIIRQSMQEHGVNFS